MKCALTFLFLSLFATSCRTSTHQVTDVPSPASFDLDSIYAVYDYADSPLLTIDFTEKIAPNYLQADLTVLRTALEEAQTSIYRYSSKAKVDDAVIQAFHAAEDSLLYLDFIKAIARVQNEIACGHSGWGHTPTYFGYRNEHVKLFPFDVTIINGQYFVKHNNSLNRTIEEGSEILRINGLAVDSLTSILRRHTMVDGKSGLKGYTALEAFLPNAYSNFIDNPEHFNLRLRHPDGQKFQASVMPLLRYQIDSIRNYHYTPTRLGIPLRLELINSNTALYTIKWFRNEYIQSQGQNFNGFTDSVFSVLAQYNIDNLIIDLRGNRGGWTANGNKLLSYLINDPIPYIRKVEVKKYKNYSFEPIIKSFPGYSDTTILSPNGKQRYEWSNYPSLVTYPAKANRFVGQCYVLIDDMSRSCSAAFSSIAQDHTNAIFVGSETGGSKCGSNAMVMTIQLPYSGVIINFSTAEYHYNVNDTTNARGVLADYTVTRNLNNEDTHLNLTLELIQGTP